MNIVKLSLLAIAVFIFAIACSQPAANTALTNDVKKPGNQANATSNTANTANTANTNGADAAPQKDETAQAAELYTKNCMTCHKDSGKGGKVTVEGKNLDVDDLTTDKMKKKSDEKLIEQVSDGAEDDGMPAFKKKLKPEEIALVVKHVRALQAK